MAARESRDFQENEARKVRRVLVESLVPRARPAEMVKEESLDRLELLV